MDEHHTEEKEGFRAEIKTSSEKKREPSLDDAYEDEFEDDIPEDIPEVVPDADLMAAATGFAGSGDGDGGITVSQSLGVDPSVDSLALEDYDHIEPVDKAM